MALTGVKRVAYAKRIYERRHEGVSNDQLWEELRYIRRKVDAVETKVLFMFGTVTAISIAITVFELLTP